MVDIAIRRSTGTSRSAGTISHQSLSDPLARLFKKTGGAEAKLAYLGHLLTENRNGMVVDVRVTQNDRDGRARRCGGDAERETGNEAIDPRRVGSAIRAIGLAW